MVNIDLFVFAQSGLEVEKLHSIASFSVEVSHGLHNQVMFVIVNTVLLIFSFEEKNLDS